MATRVGRTTIWTLLPRGRTRSCTEGAQSLVEETVANSLIAYRDLVDAKKGHNPLDQQRPGKDHIGSLCLQPGDLFTLGDRLFFEESDLPRHLGAA